MIKITTWNMILEYKGFKFSYLGWHFNEEFDLYYDTPQREVKTVKILEI